MIDYVNYIDAAKGYTSNGQTEILLYGNFILVR